MEPAILLDYKTTTREKLEGFINRKGIEYAIRQNNEEMALWVMEQNRDIEIQGLMEDIARRGWINALKKIFSMLPSIPDCQDIFDEICLDGYLEMAQYIYSVGSDSIKFHPLESGQSQVALACKYFYLPMAKWLHTLCPHILLKRDSDKGNSELKTVFCYVNEKQAGFSEQSTAITQWMYEVRPDLKEMTNGLFDICGWSCQFGNYKTMKWVLNENPEVKIEYGDHCNNVASKFKTNWFYLACISPGNNVDLVNLLYPYFKAYILQSSEQDVLHRLFGEISRNTNLRVYDWLMENASYSKEEMAISMFSWCIYLQYLKKAQEIFEKFQDSLLNIISEYFMIKTGIIKPYINRNASLATLMENDAFKSKHEDCIKWMLTVKPDVKYGSLILVDFCKKGLLLSFQLLLKQRPELYLNEKLMSQCFKGAAIEGYTELSQWILEKFPTLDIFNLVTDVFPETIANGYLSTAKWLFSIAPTIDISADDEYAFCCACENGRLRIAKWLLEVKPDINISVDDEYPFCCACENGYIEVAKWLLEVKPDIDISADDESPFGQACENGYLDVAQWLLSIKPGINISADEEYAFFQSASNNQFEVVNWLLQVKPDIDITIHNNEAFEKACENHWVRLVQLLMKFNSNYRADIIMVHSDSDEEGGFDFTQMSDDDYGVIGQWQIYMDIKCLGEITENKQEECCVCLETSDAKLQCNHYVCCGCIKQLLSQTCPYCRAKMDGYYITT
jgi:hypothetical protein